MISIASWKNHLKQKGCENSLPDGTPLKWTGSRVDIFVDITGTYVPESAHDAGLFLWAASLSDSEIRTLWTPAPGTDVDQPLARHRFPELLVRAVEWADENI